MIASLLHRSGTWRKAGATRWQRRVVAVALWASMGAFACPGTEPITVLVPYAAGGSVDVTTRVLVKAISTGMGRSFVVKNVPGASGLIAVRQLLAAPPDGCTLLSATVNNVVILPLHNRHAGFAVSDLQPVGRIGETAMLLVASLQSHLDDMADVETAARTGQTLRVGHPGTDSLQALGLKALEARLQTRLVQVPYSGGARMISDLAGGHIEMAVLARPVAMPLIERGAARLIGPLRLSEDIGLPSWSGLFSARGVPQEALLQIRRSMSQALADPAVAHALIELGMDIVGGATDAFEAEIGLTVQRIKKLLDAAASTEKTDAALQGAGTARLKSPN